ncbi:hypothetical protein MBLNU230_g8588t1 [Neophaeotheca triangularis]
MPNTSRERDSRASPARRERRRRTHQRIDSSGDVAPRSRRPRDEEYDEEPGSPSPTKSRPKRPHREREMRSSRPVESATTALSSDQLAQLDKLNRKLGWEENDGVRRKRVQDDEDARVEDDRNRAREREREHERRRQEHRERKRRRREEEKAAAAAGAASVDGGGFGYDRRQRSKGRVVSGQRLERGPSAYYSEKDDYREDVRGRDGDGSSEDYDEEARRRKRKKWIYIMIGVLVVVAIIVGVAVGVTMTGGSSDDDDDGGSGGGSGGSSSSPSNSNLKDISEDDIPDSAKGTELDPFTWYDTNDFNVTYTDEKVGGLSVMGLMSDWDDSERANENVPPLDEKWEYGTMKIRGVNLGGWLSIEPFISPSLFSEWSSRDGVVDEYTLTERLGSDRAKTKLEEHYSTWVSEQDLKDIQDAGFDHVRIPFSYWAITTYDDDPYVAKVSWRYLLRAIEWCRKHGLRVNLDLHGAPGSQNGWNHSGRQGAINWLNGTDGQKNGDRTIDIHKQISEFFTQPRYKNIITMYGLVNEPRMVELDTETVLTWTNNAVDAVRANNFTGIIIFGDGFMGLDNWQGKLQDQEKLLLDVHQYVIFNTDQIVLNHKDKLNFACKGWTAQAVRSQDTSTGFGPTLCGEWSQADTDCATNLNNVGVGSRWEGTLNMASGPGGSSDGSVLDPTCPTDNSPRCSCEEANADPADYSDEYRKWLKMFAEAQMHSFEQGWGWFYWTWKTETNAQWSYKDGLEAGMLPEKAFERDYNCDEEAPDFSSQLPEFY